jgi:hypothetical protein
MPQKMPGRKRNSPELSKGMPLTSVIVSLPEHELIAQADKPAPADKN